MTTLKWLRLTAGIVLYSALDFAGRLGDWFTDRAQRVDVVLDAWRDDLQRRDETVQLIAYKISWAIQHGGVDGKVEYAFVNHHDMDRIGLAVDNLGCFVIVGPRSLLWRRRDVSPTGQHLSLHALPPADRDAWVEAIGKLEGES